MHVVMKSSPEELFSNWVDGKNYLGFEEVKNIFAEKGLTHCPPITHSDLEDGTSGSSSSSSTSSTSTSSENGNGGKSSCSPKGEVVMDLDPKDLQILQMVESNSVCTLFEYYKLGLSMGVPDMVLSQNSC